MDNKYLWETQLYSLEAQELSDNQLVKEFEYNTKHLNMLQKQINGTLESLNTHNELIKYRQVIIQAWKAQKHELEKRRIDYKTIMEPIK